MLLVGVAEEYLGRTGIPRGLSNPNNGARLNLEVIFLVFCREYLYVEGIDGAGEGVLMTSVVIVLSAIAVDRVEEQGGIMVGVDLSSKESPGLDRDLWKGIELDVLDEVGGLLFSLFKRVSFICGERDGDEFNEEDEDVVTGSGDEEEDSEDLLSERASTSVLKLESFKV